ncbi:AhpC/TSA family protein [Nitzschia inconspicua]|uniref:AhpC/TSA family protein n=1 Tax=Nitzschia inconspicua TaxID=303405 RepID=A0A9K3PU92_9STRA|nr:AhpC/TSA family protein [Nitzschia inconspicua]
MKRDRTVEASNGNALFCSTWGKVSTEQRTSKQSWQRNLLLHDRSRRKDATKKKDKDLFERLLTSTRGAIPTENDTESAFIASIKVDQGPKHKVKTAKTPKPTIKTPKEDKEDEMVAQREFFERLIYLETSNALGSIGAAQLVPWVPPYLTDCLVVFADPRSSSGDLRQAIKYLTSNLYEQSDKFWKQVVFVTVDSVPEMRSWIQRTNISTSIRIFCDPDLKFMTAYGLTVKELDSRWSMSLLVFDTDGRKPETVRNVDPSHAAQMALKVMKEYEPKR